MAADISQLLVQWSQGEEAALDELMPLVYDELRILGRSYLGRRPAEAVLQPTVLVHEAWMKLVNKDSLTVQCRAQFYGLASKIMRELLVDHFRRQTAARRGGSQVQLALDDSHPADSAGPSADLIALDDALQKLGGIKERYARIVDLKFFGGLTTEEIADVLKTSRATIEREWSFARAWLKRELGN